MHGEYKNEEMVRYGLEVTVEGMECMGCEGGRYEPFVMRFVHVFVDAGVVQRAVDPVYAIVREEEEAVNKVELALLSCGRGRMERTKISRR